MFSTWRVSTKGWKKEVKDISSPLWTVCNSHLKIILVSYQTKKKKKKMNTHDPWLEIQNVFSVRKVRKNSFVFIGVMCAGLQVRTPENGFQTWLDVSVQICLCVLKAINFWVCDQISDQAVMAYSQMSEVAWPSNWAPILLLLPSPIFCFFRRPG